MRSILSMTLAALLASAPIAHCEPLPSDATEAMKALSKSTAALAKFARQGLVLISVEHGSFQRPSGFGQSFQFGRPEPSGLGSGFLIDLDHGYAVTNNHVVQGAARITVKLANGQSRAAHVVGRDPRTDIAVLQVESLPKEGLTALSFADSSALEVGHFVAALGAPFGLEATLTVGVVSAVGRGSLDIAQLGDFIQTDAAINPGMSGGPLLDAAGNVVGVNTAIFSRSGAYDGIGFAVPATIARTVSGRLIADGHMARGYIGLSLSDGKDTGAHVAAVDPRGPAAAAGFAPGDVVIEANGRTVKGAAELTTIVGLTPPKTKVSFKIQRGESFKTLEAIVDDWPRDLAEQR